MRLFPCGVLEAREASFVSDSDVSRFTNDEDAKSAQSTANSHLQTGRCKNSREN